MKPTIRVSIGGLAFNLDEDAYSVLNDYLNALRKHFENNQESGEIISDIELRLSELLQIRIGSTDSVVSMSDALEIIKIMGSPKDFEDIALVDEYAEEGAPKKTYGTTSIPNDEAQDFFKKKLYRDTENKLIGGVCSGLSHYFRIDVTVMRLLFTGIFLALFFFAFRGPSCMVVVLIYSILWVVMPAAHSFTQKLSMTGSDPSIHNIEDRTQPSTRKYKGSSLASVIGVILNIFIGILAAILLLIIVALAVSFIWLHFDTSIFGLNNYLILLGLNSINIKVAFLLSFFIPLIGLLWLLVKTIKRSPFTTQTLISFVIGFVVWLGTSFYVGNAGVKFGLKHRHKVEAVENIAVNTTSDSLYIKLGSEYLKAESQPNNPFVLYAGESYSDRKLCVLPNIKITEDSTLTNYAIDIYKKNFSDNEMTAKRKAEELRIEYTLTDSLLTINPQWYTESKPWNLEMYEIVVKTPKSKKIIREYPLNKSYNNFHFKINTYDHHYYYNPFTN